AELSTLVRDTLLHHGVASEQIHLELFFGYAHTDRRGTEQAQPATVTFTLTGKRNTIELQAGDTLLDAALQRRPDTPYACMGGACGTCRAKLIGGTIEMDQNFALSQADLDAGYILTCQSRPTCPTVTIDYDA